MVTTEYPQPVAAAWVATAVVAWLLAAGPANAQQVYPTTPDWVSADTQVSTGGALVDLNGDGWLDLVVANGNDMAQQRLVVYHGLGNGSLPTLPTWQSADLAYNGHLDVADVNGDGWPDVAVAYLGEFSTTGPIARVYLNNAGTLSSTADWSADVSGNAFGLAFGDLNNDGRPDLAVATGWPYSNPNAYYNYVYLNVGGQLQTPAAWQSSDRNDYMGALWVDADDDGWLDLACVGARTEARIYRNVGGALETTASWSTADNPNPYAIMAAAGDVTGDGLRDLFVTDNTQLAGGTGRFRQYNGLAGGFFTTTPQWFFHSSQHAYGSAVALADLNGDGRLDLVTGAWWSRTRLFLNHGSGFNTAPSWLSTPSSVVEKIVFGDLNRDGLRPVVETFGVTTPRQLFYLSHQPIQQVLSVRMDGVELTPAEYAFNRENGWVTVSAAPVALLRVEYTCSSRLDMAVTNWDNTVGNHLYYHQYAAPGDANCDGRLDEGDIPFFVLLLVNRSAYDQALPDCDALATCDLSGDGLLDGRDLQPFVSLLAGE